MFKNLKESFLLIFNDNSFLVEKRDVVEAKLTPSTHIPVLLMLSLLFIYSQHTYPSAVIVFLYFFCTFRRFLVLSLCYPYRCCASNSHPRVPGRQSNPELILVQSGELTI